MDAVNVGAAMDPMAHPVNQAMVNAVESSLQMETELTEASVRAQVGAVESQAGIADGDTGQIINVQA